MSQQPTLSHPLTSLYRLPTPPTPVSPLQVLVVDRLMGPAAVLGDTLARVVGNRIALTVVEDHIDALRAATDCCFDVVLVGVEDDLLQLTVVPHLHVRAPNLPVLVVGHRLNWVQAEQARRYGARDVFALPRRAADLRQLAGRLVTHYTPSAACAC